ncbi:hypothetical protein CDA61_00045 [Alcaligenes faecalis]|nr:hypothetical protein CDA61_00045 [Alcaligenes faecalis]
MSPRDKARLLTCYAWLQQIRKTTQAVKDHLDAFTGLNAPKETPLGLMRRFPQMAWTKPLEEPF